MSTLDTHERDRALVEAALFLAPQPLTRRGLAKILEGVPLAYIDRMLEELQVEYAKPMHGIELHIEEGRAMLRVKAAHVNAVAHLAPQQDIPRPVLRTLAVIAYNHPMTQADAVRVRGNKAYGHIQELLERELIRAEDHGRTLLLHVTREFLRHFGLNSVEEFRFHFSAAPEEVELESEEDTDASEQSPGHGGTEASGTEGEVQPKADPTQSPQETPVRSETAQAERGNASQETAVEDPSLREARAGDIDTRTAEEDPQADNAPADPEAAEEVEDG